MRCIRFLASFISFFSRFQLATTVHICNEQNKQKAFKLLSFPTSSIREKLYQCHDYLTQRERWRPLSYQYITEGISAMVIK